MQEQKSKKNLSEDRKPSGDNSGIELKPSFEKQVRASFDKEGVYVFQAYTPFTAGNALEKGTFGTGFNRGRMTWVKPSFGWMLYRSNYASSPRQESILRIKMTHEGFRQLLNEAVLSHFSADVFDSHESWDASLKASSARVQWDPDRDLGLNVIEGQRAIQIGIGPPLTNEYVDNWIVSIDDVTAVAKGISRSVEQGKAAKDIKHPFPEDVYEVPRDTAFRLGMLAG